MPYAGGRLSLVVLLPDPGRLAELESSLDATGFERLLGQLKVVSIALSFPKCRIRYEQELRGALAALGMINVFDPMLADLSGIGGSGDLAVSALVHKAFIEVTEKGTEAAAATGAVMELTSYSPLPTAVTVDRPFLFAIRDRETGTILFLGRVMDPR